jgi:mutator protein MutT
MTDYLATKFPVSVKGVLIWNGGIVLLKNERDEWELPGGKLEVSESLEGCLTREIAEETGIEVEVGPLLNTWVYHVNKTDVLIVSFLCVVKEHAGELVLSSEHKEIRTFQITDVSQLRMPKGYKDAITTAFPFAQGR